MYVDVAHMQLIETDGIDWPSDNHPTMTTTSTRTQITHIKHATPKIIYTMVIPPFAKSNLYVFSLGGLPKSS